MSDRRGRVLSMPDPAPSTPVDPQSLCPVCGAVLVHEKCKVVCRSARCVYRIIFNCSEF